MSGQDPRTYVSPRETSEFARFELRPSHLKTRIPGGADMRGTYISARPLVEPATAHAAALTVCDHAHDADEARHLLTTLGLEGTT